ncbi:PREDICTED: root meristem growth factor 1 [Tarenaya hassleriana]|uniref:root meristem growth factor 1 n=1 Tax=Tarenaya hassleriana TaxID=28532 RepID=UPI00053C1F6B|nr:PREDICTED: root meristem growth factor 1 [Tarenaya hassleriana]
MVSIRVSCSLLILLILQLHAHVSNSKEILPQATKGGELQSVTSTINPNEKNVGNGMRNRKMLKGEKKDVEAETTEELVRGEERNEENELKTASLTADYSDPLHHPPRHN